MIGKILKKLVGKSDDTNNSDKTASGSLISSLHEKSDKLVNFIGEKIQQANQEFFTIKDRISNLRETNYKLGLKHLENGNITDAIFRFRFINKFWPDLLDSQYQLAYCLTLNNKPIEAKLILQKLLAHHPDYDQKAYDLLEHIEEGIKHQNFDA